MKICCKTKDNFMLITFKNTTYQIDKGKLMYIINLLDTLSGKKSSFKNDTEIAEKLAELDLLNEDFLNNINKLW